MVLPPARQRPHDHAHEARARAGARRAAAHLLLDTRATPSGSRRRIIENISSCSPTDSSSRSDGDRVVGATTTLRLHFDFDHVDHTFADVIQGGWLTSHEPGGDWLYGADIGIDPGFRNRGLGRALYAARQEVVWRLGLRGQVTAGMISGYGAVKQRMTADDYYAGVVAGDIVDPTLTMQLAVGFRARGLIANYLDDPVSDNYAVLLVMDADQEVPGASRTQARSHIRLNTEIPGPRARDILARPSGRDARRPRPRHRRRRRACARRADLRRGWQHAHRSRGRSGHARGRAHAAGGCRCDREAGREYIHTCALVTSYEPYVRLAEILNEITPGSFAKKTMLANSGAEAVECAVMLARKFTGRPSIVCFEGAYHGRTLLALSLTSKYGLFKSGFGPFAPEIVRLPMPHVYRTPAGMTEEQYVDFGIRQLEQALVAQVEPSAIAAIIVEPVQGEAGFIPVPPRFLARIRSLCEQHGIVMIADEVQCGFGRTGRLFAVEHYGVVPDVIITAKSLGAGMPIAAVTGRAEILDSAHLGGVGGTYGGSPVACAAAVAAIDIIRQPECPCPCATARRRDA